jgi:uncharacterized linocin/CFP29 family protein
MDYLRRAYAPVSERVWKALDEAVTQSARHVMTARRVATFDGPHGWDHVGARVGTWRPCAVPESKAAVCMPDVVLLAELRADFSLPWAAIEVYERGAPALDVTAAEAAAREVAVAEDVLLYYGEPTGGGYLTGKSSPRIQAGDWSKPGRLLEDLLRAVQTLDERGINGPYEAVLPPSGYYMYLRAIAEGGYPTARQLKPVLEHVHRAPVLREAGAVFSTRGDDFVLTVGGDLSVGYRQHDGDAVHLMCVETIAAQAVTPDAVCVLTQ